MRPLPRRRTDLVVTELDGENVVFDAADNTVHALAPTAVAVWALCDGALSVDAAAAQLGLTATEVTGACDDLLAAGLAVAPGYTRRRVLQGTAVAAGAAMVSSALMPAAAANASPTTGGGGQGGGRTLSYNLYNERATNNSTGPFFFYQGNSAATAAAVTATSSPASDGNSSGVATGFQGTDPGQPGDPGSYPLFYTTSGGTFTTSGTVSVPNGTFAIHPGPDVAAIIGFKNTTGVAAAVTLMGSITGRDTTGYGNGVRLRIVDASDTQAGATVATSGAAGDSQSFTASFTSIAAGSSVYVIIDNNGGYQYDTTGVDLTVTIG